MRAFHGMGAAFEWLEQKQLTADAREFWEINLTSQNASPSDYFSLFSSSDSIWGIQPPLPQLDMTKEQWDDIRTSNTPRFEEKIKRFEKRIVSEVLEKPSKIKVKINRVPPDALAFYRPFHYQPYREWGIYFILPRFLKYINEIMPPLEKGYLMFRPEVVTTLVIFEVFHHEHYHHLVESTAFTLETILAEFGMTQSIYLPYNRRNRSDEVKKYNPHVPLEEALANAYAYNSISFAQRTKPHFDIGVMKAYQAVIKQHWRLEPQGYCDAQNYTGANTIIGNISLLKIMMNSELDQNMVALERIVSRVMPSGYTSMVPKPNMPTYFLGNEQDFAKLRNYVPNPKAAYAYLEFPFNTDQISKLIKIEKERRKKAKKKSKLTQQRLFK